MKVALICEFSGVEREAFREEGHEAYSFDLLPSEDNSPYHIQGDALEQDYRGFDLGICHPPCTDLAVSGARWWKGKPDDAQMLAIRFAWALWKLPIPLLAMENPVGALTWWRKPDQIIHPYQFGEPVKKTICLWLRGLPRLEPTILLDKSDARPDIHHASPGPDRWKVRSRSFYGVAYAMARQWGQFVS